jgi:hypothetical protein
MNKRTIERLMEFLRTVPAARREAKLARLEGGLSRSDLFAVFGTEAEVCRDIERRQQMGISKYGTTVAENPLPLREWLDHAYQETLDKAIYLKRAIAEIDSANATVEARDL